MFHYYYKLDRNYTCRPTCRRKERWKWNVVINKSMVVISVYLNVSQLSSFRELNKYYIHDRIKKFALRSVLINKQRDVKTVARLLVDGMKCRGIKIMSGINCHGTKCRSTKCRDTCRCVYGNCVTFRQWRIHWLLWNWQLIKLAE